MLATEHVAGSFDKHIAQPLLVPDSVLGPILTSAALTARRALWDLKSRQIIARSRKIGRFFVLLGSANFLGLSVRQGSPR